MSICAKHLHFMGIGGIGVSALAELSLKHGAIVSGCDREYNDQTAYLQKLGVNILIGHDASHCVDVDLLVYSSAIPINHPELLAAKSSKRRGSFLASFLSSTKSIGVCGTHGKTTTTCLLGYLLLSAGLDPTIYLGGVSGNLGSNFHYGFGDWFVAELDESDGSFLEPDLKIGVLTNLESDHLSYYGSDDALYLAFKKFSQKLIDSDSLLVAGLDDPKVSSLYQNHCGRKISYGFTSAADVRAVFIRQDIDCQIFQVNYFNKPLGEFSLPLPGLYNIKNFLAALAVALELGVDANIICNKLPYFKNAQRRMELLGTKQGSAIYSDYAHHPTEVLAAISGLNSKYSNDVLVVFQPHLYSRTKDYYREFAESLSCAKSVLLLDIYPAREDPIPGVSSDLIFNILKDKGNAALGVYNLDSIKTILPAYFGSFAAIVFMGAGNIDNIARKILADV